MTDKPVKTDYSKRKLFSKYRNRIKPKYCKGDYVLLKDDKAHILFCVYDVKETGYSLINVRSGIILPNTVEEKNLIIAKEGVDYDTI